MFKDHREQIDEYEIFRACQQSVCYMIRQSCSCICTSRRVAVRGNDSCKIIKDPLNGAY